MDKRHGIMLNVCEYETLLKRFAGKQDCVIQNYYLYDSRDFKYYKSGFTYYVRQSGTDRTTTVEAKDTSTEYIAELYRCIDESVPLWLVEGDEIYIKGMIRTHRVCLLCFEKVAVFLDRNEYQNTVDYELLIIYSPEKKDFSHKILNVFREYLYRSTTVSEIEPGYMSKSWRLISKLTDGIKGENDLIH